jgi:hypothetical protein
VGAQKCIEPLTPRFSARTIATRERASLVRLLLAVRLGTGQTHRSDAGLHRYRRHVVCFSLEPMMTSRLNILLVLVTGALTGCVTDALGDDPDSDLDLDPGADPEGRRRPRPDPRPAPDPTPSPGCTLVGGPSTLGATLDAFEYEVTGGPTGTGDGTFLRMAPDGTVTLRTSARGTEQGWLDGLTQYGIFRKATSAQLPTLCATYSCTGCASDYIHNVTILFNGVPYTVRSGFGASPPERLVTLINAMHDITTRPLQ